MSHIHVQYIQENTYHITTYHITTHACMHRPTERPTETIPFVLSCLSFIFKSVRLEFNYQRADFFSR